MTTATPDSVIETRPYVWMTILVAASVLFSLGLACAMPFAAVAAVAALALGRRDALLLVGLAWLANQAVGFGLLHYPRTADCLAWGLALLAVSILATFAAMVCVTRFGTRPRAAAALLAFLAAFITYEGLLLILSVVVGSGTEASAPGIVAKIFALNAAAFGAFIVTFRLRQWTLRRSQAFVPSGAVG